MQIKTLLVMLFLSFTLLSCEENADDSSSVNESTLVSGDESKSALSDGDGDGVFDDYDLDPSNPAVEAIMYSEATIISAFSQDEKGSWLPLNTIHSSQLSLKPLILNGVGFEQDEWVILVRNHSDVLYNIEPDNLETDLQFFIPEDIEPGSYLLQVSNGLVSSNVVPVEITQNNAPVIERIFPASPIAGQVLSITGKNIEKGTQVLFDDDLFDCQVVEESCEISIPQEWSSGLFRLKNSYGVSDPSDLMVFRRIDVKVEDIITLPSGSRIESGAELISWDGTQTSILIENAKSKNLQVFSGEDQNLNRLFEAWVAKDSDSVIVGTRSTAESTFASLLMMNGAEVQDLSKDTFNSLVSLEEVRAFVDELGGLLLTHLYQSDFTVTPDLQSSVQPAISIAMESLYSKSSAGEELSSRRDALYPFSSSPVVSTQGKISTEVKGNDVSIINNSRLFISVAVREKSNSFYVTGYEHVTSTYDPNMVDSLSGGITPIFKKPGRRTIHLEKPGEYGIQVLTPSIFDSFAADDEMKAAIWELRWRTGISNVIIPVVSALIGNKIDDKLGNAIIFGIASTLPQAFDTYSQTLAEDPKGAFETIVSPIVEDWTQAGPLYWTVINNLTSYSGQKYFASPQRSPWQLKLFKGAHLTLTSVGPIAFTIKDMTLEPGVLNFSVNIPPESEPPVSSSSSSTSSSSSSSTSSSSSSSTSSSSSSSTSSSSSSSTSSSSSSSTSSSSSSSTSSSSSSSTSSSSSSSTSSSSSSSTSSSSSSSTSSSSSSSTSSSSSSSTSSSSSSSTSSSSSSSTSSSSGNTVPGDRQTRIRLGLWHKLKMPDGTGRLPDSFEAISLHLNGEKLTKTSRNVIKRESVGDLGTGAEESTLLDDYEVYLTPGEYSMEVRAERCSYDYGCRFEVRFPNKGVLVDGQPIGELINDDASTIINFEVVNTFGENSDGSPGLIVIPRRTIYFDNSAGNEIRDCGVPVGELFAITGIRAAIYKNNFGVELGYSSIDRESGQLGERQWKVCRDEGDHEIELLLPEGFMATGFSISQSGDNIGGLIINAARLNIEDGELFDYEDFGEGDSSMKILNALDFGFHKGIVTDLYLESYRGYIDHFGISVGDLVLEGSDSND